MKLFFRIHQLHHSYHPNRFLLRRGFCAGFDPNKEARKEILRKDLAKLVEVPMTTDNLLLSPQKREKFMENLRSTVQTTLQHVDSNLYHRYETSWQELMDQRPVSTLTVALNLLKSHGRRKINKIQEDGTSTVSYLSSVQEEILRNVNRF